MYKIFKCLEIFRFLFGSCRKKAIVFGTAVSFSKDLGKKGKEMLVPHPLISTKFTAGVPRILKTLRTK